MDTRLGRWLRLWICYVLAAGAQRMGRRPLAKNPDRQAELDQMWGRMLRGAVDDWQRRRHLVRDNTAWS